MSSKDSSSPQALHIFYFEPSNRIGSTHIVAENAPPHTEPLYTIEKCREPDYTLSRGGLATPDTTFGTATEHSSRPCDLVLHGQTFRMKMSWMSGNYSLETPAYGKLKWKVDPLGLGSSSMELKDGAGTRLAKYSSASHRNKGQKKLQVFVNCDPVLLQLIMLSAFVGKAISKNIDDAVAHVVEAAVT